MKDNEIKNITFKYLLDKHRRIKATIEEAALNYSTHQNLFVNDFNTTKESPTIDKPKYCKTDNFGNIVIFL